jgi:hypothetical protein
VSVTFSAVALPLAFTVLIETGVGALFGLRRRALGAVASLNLVTNPILSLSLVALFGFGVGYPSADAPQSPLRYATTAPWIWVILVLLEAMVVVAEWRGLVWALGPRSTTSRRLLSVSLAMNFASATLGTFLLARLF